MTRKSSIEPLLRRLAHPMDGELGPYLKKWIPLSILVGVLGGVGALVFQTLLEWVWDAAYGPSLPWYVVLLVPAAGGLLAGLVMMLAPETAGAGTDRVIDAVHNHGGRLRARAVPVKMVASSLTIGSGGSSGNEGPISQISGSIASFVGTKLRLSRSEMRILVISGMAAGWSAVFRAPLGSAIFAIEVPYKNDFESRAVIPSIIASVTSYLVFVPLGGADPIFFSDLPGVSLTPELLLLVLLLGALVGAVGILFVLLLDAVAKLFRRSSLPLPATTSLGGLAVGMIGLAYPQVLGLGEGAIQLILSGGLVSLGLLLAIVAAKMVATSMTVGSGGSGGIFFPSLMIGGAVGGTLALALGLQPYALFVLVGMGAMMAGVSKTPIAAAVLMTEMVGGFAVLIPLMIATTVSYLVTGRHSLYKKQVTSGEIGLDFSTLGEVKVQAVMEREPLTVDPTDPPQQLSRLIREHPHHIYPVVEDGRPVGIVTREAILRKGDGAYTVAEVMETSFHSLPSSAPAAEAFELMAARKVASVVVVDGDGRLKGIVTRIDLLNAMEHLDERHHAF